MRTAFRNLLLFVGLLGFSGWPGTLVCTRAAELESARRLPVQGQVADGSNTVVLSLGLPDGMAGPQWSLPVSGTGFAATVKLFPGSNVIRADSASGNQEHRVEVNVDAPNVRVELSWAGGKQDYDLYCNEIYFGNPGGANGGRLDRDSVADESQATENITFDQAAAGLYRVYVNYYANNTDQRDADDNPVPNPLPTTVRVFVNDQQVYSATQLLSKPEGHSSDLGDGKSSWSVCTLVVHSGQGIGGLQVDEEGYRDLVPQKTVLGRISPRTTYSVDDVQGPNGGGNVYLMVGQSAQFHALGTINKGSDNEQGGVDLIEHFASSNGSVANVDALGVVTGLVPGEAFISSDGGGGAGAAPSGSSTNGGGAQTDQAGGGGAAVQVLGVSLTQTNYPAEAAPREIRAGETALITAEPRMPQLIATITGAPAPGATVTWSLTTAYARRGARDNKTFGPVTLPATGTWDIGAAFGPNFCGGTATLNYRISGLPQRSLTFNIKGKNPPDATAKAYIVGQQGAFPYAWAIVRHESRQDRKVYNQFNVGGALVDQPNYSADGKDGWGMFQRDGSQGGVPASTQETWNWQVNVVGGVTELTRKRSLAASYFRAVQRTYPTTYEEPPAPAVVAGTTTTVNYLDAAVITLYNGASVTKRLWTGDTDNQGNKIFEFYSSCWEFDPVKPAGQRWSGPVPNVNNYLYKIIFDEYEDHMPTEE